MRERDDRHSEVAADVSGLPEEDAARHLTSADVVLDWPTDAERTQGGRALIETAANLIVRFAPGLRIAKRSPFATEVADLVRQIDSSARPMSTDVVDPVVVWLGGDRAECHVSGSADGWTAFVSGTGDALPPVTDTGNVLGAHAAAAFVASEVFRHALPLREGFWWHAALTEYSVFDYGEPESDAPDMGAPRFRTVPLLVGVGAVGQACVDTLASLRTSGAIRCVDKGYVDDETNLNRSVLALEQDLDGPAPKVELATRRVAGSDLRVIAHLEELSSVLAKIDVDDIPWPRVVASALDSAKDRRVLQGVWPDVTLDAATGGSMVQIFRHVGDSELACLRCLHVDNGAGMSYQQTMAERTGLSVEDVARALADPGAPFDAGSLSRMKADVRGLAEQHVGSGVCGFLSAVEALGNTQGSEPRLVSVSFSSYLAGVFLAAELVKTELGIDTRLAGRYQIDPLSNLLPEGPFAQKRRSGCFCRVRAPQVSRFRREMAQRE